MTGLAWYPLYPGDYARDTQQLSLLEHGAYLLLMNHYYSTGSLDCMIERSSNDESSDEQPVNNLRIYRLCSAISDEEKKAVDVVLKLFFTYKKGKYISRKIEEVIAEQTEKHKKKSEAARLAVAAREERRKSSSRSSNGQSNDQPSDHRTINKRSSNQNQNQNQKFIPSSDKSSEEIALPDFVSKELWDGYVEMREKPNKNGKKKPLTELAKKLTIKKLTGFESKQKGWANLALENAIQGSWQGVHEPDAREAKTTKQIHNNFNNQDYDKGTEGFLTD